MNFERTKTIRQENSSEINPQRIKLNRPARAAKISNKGSYYSEPQGTAVLLINLLKLKDS
jgi:hypothetical protein